MHSSAQISTLREPRRARRRISVDEVPTLDADQVAAATRPGQAAQVMVRWSGPEFAVVVARSGEELTVQDEKGHDLGRIELVPVKVLGRRTRFLFRCQGCGERRCHLHLRDGAGGWRCRRCHRLGPRRRDRDALDGLQRSWEEIGERIAHLRLIRRYGAAPIVEALVGQRDDDLDVGALKQEIASVRTRLDRMAPPGMERA